MNAVLISSESRMLIKEQIDEIISSSQNIINYDLDNCSIEDIINEASYINLIEEQKYIIVKNCNIFSSAKMKKEDENLLTKYLQDPNLNTTIIFTLQKSISLKNPIVSIIKKQYKIIEIPKMNEYNLVKKIMSDLKKQHYNIDYETSKYIVKNCLNNYDLIFNELEKIKIFYGDKKDILLNDVKNLISNNIEDNVFKLVNSVIEKDDKMYKYFQDLKLFKEDPIKLIVLIAREYRYMYILKNVQDMDEQELCKKLKIQKWQLDKFKRNAYSYKSEELKENIQSLFNLDKNIKNGKIDKYLGFELFMLNLN